MSRYVLLATAGLLVIVMCGAFGSGAATSTAASRPASSPATRSVPAALSPAVEAMKDGHHATALARLDTLDNLKSDPAWLLARGLAMAGMQNDDGALECLEKAAAAAPNWPEPRLQLGVMKVLTSRPSDAPAAFTKARDLDASDARPQYALALLQMRLQLPTAAAASLAAAEKCGGPFGRSAADLRAAQAEASRQRAADREPIQKEIDSIRKKMDDNNAMLRKLDRDKSEELAAAERQRADARQLCDNACNTAETDYNNAVSKLDKNAKDYGRRRDALTLQRDRTCTDARRALSDTTKALVQRYQPRINDLESQAGQYIKDNKTLQQSLDLQSRKLAALAGAAPTTLPADFDYRQQFVRLQQSALDVLAAGLTAASQPAATQP
jgi:hypothetical protein